MKKSLKIKDELSLRSSNVKLIGLGLTMASRAVRMFFDKALKDYGISMNQAYIMYAIAEYRDHHAQYISKKLFISRSSLWLFIDGMKEYVSIHKLPGKRFKFPALTKKGSELLMIIMPKIIKIEKEISLLVKGGDFFIEFISIFSTEIVKSTLKLNKENRRGKEKDDSKKTRIKKEKGS
jgi:DNA-binding MarR family transcriptional regulator